MNGKKGTYDYFLQLLCAGLYGCGGAGLGVDLTPDQWRAVMAETERQTVTGIVFDAVSHLPEEEMPAEDILVLWLAKTHRIVKANDRMSEALSELIPFFEERGLHPVLQKGHGVARFYSKPELRACGDIDLWFPGRERKEADALIAGRGISVMGSPDNGSRYLFGRTEVEHHSMLVEIHSPVHTRLLTKVCEIYGRERVTLSGDLMVDVPAPMIELLMINVHILKHCLGVGIGLRQFCDYSMAWRGMTNGNYAEVDKDEYFEVCRRLGILKWTGVLHEFINRYLPAADGDAVAPLPGHSDGKSVERIFTMVTEGGNFGHYNRRQGLNSGNRVFQRKITTMSAFLGNRSLARHLAPAEAFWTFAQLLLGQVH